MLRRFAVVAVNGIAAGLAAWAIAACAHPRYIVNRQVTGTCGGACDTYLECRGDGTDRKWSACVSECTDFFNDQQALRELERMDCQDIIAFIEGPSGRAPGDPPSHTASAAERGSSSSQR